MKPLTLLLCVVAAASAQAPVTVPDVDTIAGVYQQLADEHVNPDIIVMADCIWNDNPCSPSSGLPCCLSPTFSCQSNPKAGGAFQCLVSPGHVPHIPRVRRIMHTFHISTENPVYK